MGTEGGGGDTGKRPKPPGLVHTWGPPPDTKPSDTHEREAAPPPISEPPPHAQMIVEGPKDPSEPRLPRGSRTLAGIQPVKASQPAPAVPKPSKAAEALFKSKSRVTLDLSGAVLPLPGEAAPAATLDSDTPMLGIPTTPVSERETEPEPKRASQVLELDLPPDEPKRPPHDAWTVDRKRRSTPAPMSTPGEGITAPWLPAVGRLPRAPALALDAPSGALDLIERNRPSSPDLDLAGEMAERYALGDFTGALKTAEFMLGRNPTDATALRYARSSRERLEQIYSSRLGTLERIPVVIVPDRSVRWLGLDHRAGFLLSRITGDHTVDEIVDVSGMPRLEALKTLVELLDLNAIRMEDPR